MALAIDASSPAVATQTNTSTATVTTASFTPPAGSLLYIRWNWNDGGLADNPANPSITDNLGAHLTYTLLDFQSNDVSPNVDGQAAHWSAPVVTSQAMTITVTAGAGTSNHAGALYVNVMTDGGNSPTIGAHGKSGSASASSIAQSFTATATNSWGMIGVTDWDAKGNMTAGTGCTLQSTGTPGAQISYGTVRRTSADGTSGSSTTLNVSPAAASTNLNWVYAEIVPAVTSIPWTPPRPVPAREPGGAWWIQRDRRDANTVATAANPLPSPLDTAWQAGGGYWHLYADSALRDRRVYPYQRLYVSDPSLLTPVNADPLLVGAGVGGDEWRRYNLPAFADRREVPQQRPYVSDPSLLTTALLETELLGSADDLARHRNTSVYIGRRLVPQQPKRDATTPGLLDTALLEGALLGCADDLRRRQTGAYQDRRLVPQQRLYVSDPLLLTTAELENELLGGADDLRRHATISVYLDRRLVPQQRPYVSPVGLLDTAQLDELLGGADTGRRYAAPATHTPRWWMPEQPKRDGYTPGLLDSALLENELLGVADDLSRHRHAAAYTDRRMVPQQRQYISVPGLLDTALLETELLGGASTSQRANAAASHAPRWWMPQQPARSTWYYDAGPDVPPLTLSWGAGGRYWALYNQPGWQPDRREVPQQRAYISDPSSYPVTPATDPLTVAWGAGGTYWLVYNTAAEQVDRRLVPQQRRYISDPGLLTTALLEDVLLGSADDLRRRQGAPYDRRLVPQQRVYNDPSLLASALLEAELLGGADTARHQHVAAYVDRRQVPQQRLYVSDPGLLLTALLEGVLLGSGDDLRRRYGQAATHGDRRQTVQTARGADPSLLTPPADADPLMLFGGTSAVRYPTALFIPARGPLPRQPPCWTVYYTPVGPLQDLMLRLSGPQSKWTVGDPARSRWSIDTAAAKWTVGEPE